MRSLSPLPQMVVSPGIRRLELPGHFDQAEISIALFSPFHQERIIFLGRLPFSYQAVASALFPMQSEASTRIMSGTAYQLRKVKINEGRASTAAFQRES